MVEKFYCYWQDGDWNKVSAALGFKDRVTDMVVVQKATGVTDKGQN